MDFPVSHIQMFSFQSTCMIWGNTVYVLKPIIGYKENPNSPETCPSLFCSISTLWILRKLLPTVNPDCFCSGHNYGINSESKTWFQTLQTIKSNRTLLKMGKSQSKPATQPQLQFQAKALVISEIHTQRN